MSNASDTCSCVTWDAVDMDYTAIPTTLVQCTDGYCLDQDETPVYRSAAAPLHTRLVLYASSDPQHDDRTATIPVRAMNERLLELLNRWRYFF